MKEVDLLREELGFVRRIINNDPTFIAAMKASNDAETNWQKTPYKETDPKALTCPEWFRYQDAKLNCKKVYHNLIAREGMETKLSRFHALLKEEHEKTLYSKAVVWQRKRK